jgi:hypothetical protein
MKIRNKTPNSKIQNRKHKTQNTKHKTESTKHKAQRMNNDEKG